MNANELADKLEKCCLVSWGECTHEDYDTDIWAKMKCASMLRQQQAEIEALKKEAALQRLSDFTQEADNEPVAWIGETLMGRQYINGSNGLLPVGTPLYTHPIKELTDKEIVSFINKHIDYVPDGDGMKLVGVMDFARAILRKAREK